MIFLDKDEGQPPPEPLADTLPAPMMIGRVAAELDRVAMHLADLEAALIPLLGEDLGTHERTTLQSIDLAQQSLDALAGVLNLSATQMATDPIDMDTVTSSVTLRDLKNRLARLAGSN